MLPPLHIPTIILALVQTETMDEYIDLTIVYIFAASGLTVFVPFTLALLGLNKLDQGMKYFAALLCLVLVSETTAFLVGAYFKVNNLLIYDIFTALEYVFLIAVFSCWFERGWFRTAMFASVPVFLSVWISAKLFVEVSGEFDSIFLSIESVVFVMISVVTLTKEMRDSTVLLADNPHFWIASGTLVYFAGNLFVFALIEQLLQPSVTRYHSAWLIHSGLNVTKNILFSLGFLSTGAPAERLRQWRSRNAAQEG